MGTLDGILAEVGTQFGLTNSKASSLLSSLRRKPLLWTADLRALQLTLTLPPSLNVNFHVTPV